MEEDGLASGLTPEKGRTVIVQVDRGSRVFEEEADQMYDPNLLSDGKAGQKTYRSQQQSCSNTARSGNNSRLSKQSRRGTRRNSA